MVDIVDAATRSRMMSGIRGRNTKPELLIRSLLHRQGFRFRLDVRDLPGRPDIVLPRYRAVVSNYRSSAESPTSPPPWTSAGFRPIARAR